MFTTWVRTCGCVLKQNSKKKILENKDGVRHAISQPAQAHPHSVIFSPSCFVVNLPVVPIVREMRPVTTVQITTLNQRSTTIELVAYRTVTLFPHSNCRNDPPPLTTFVDPRSISLGTFYTSIPFANRHNRPTTPTKKM